MQGTMLSKGYLIDARSGSRANGPGDEGACPIHGRLIAWHQRARVIEARIRQPHSEVHPRHVGG